MSDETFTRSRDEKHFGFWCAAGTQIDPFERSGTLAKNHLFRGALLPKGSRFWHDVDFDYVTVESNGPIRIRGHLFGDETRVEFSPRVEWEAWTSSWVIWLLLPVTAPLFLLGAAFRRLNRWMAIIPSESMTIDGVAIVPGDRVELWRDGELKSLLLHAPRKVAGHRFDTGRLTWNTRGELTEALLYRPQEVHGIPCVGIGLANTQVKFHPDGTVRECVLAGDYTHGGTTFPRGTRLRIDREGEAYSVERMDVDVSVYAHRPEIHRTAADAAERDEPVH